jgi:hypothetical protein
MCWSRAVSARLSVVLCVLICVLLCVVWLRIALATVIVCVSAVLESEMMMHGCPGGTASCAMVMARSSAVLLPVEVHGFL